MGKVIALRRKSPAKLPDPELALLTHLNASLNVRQREGWATRGEPRGVVLRRQGRPLGLWSYVDGNYRYLSVHDARTIIVAMTLDEAHSATLRLLGPLAVDRSAASTTPNAQPAGGGLVSGLLAALDRQRS